MTPAQDPFYVVKEEIQESVSHCPLIICELVTKRIGHFSLASNSMIDQGICPKPVHSEKLDSLFDVPMQVGITLLFSKSNENSV